MKLTADRPFADAEKAARKVLEIANTTEAVHDGRMFIEKINGQFLFKEGGDLRISQSSSGRLVGRITWASR